MWSFVKETAVELAVGLLVSAAVAVPLVLFVGPRLLPFIPAGYAAELTYQH